MKLDEVEVLLTQEAVRNRIKELAGEISRDYAGQEILVVGILKGAFIFMADLVREIDIPLKLDFMDVSSYGISTVSSGEVRIMKDLEESIEGKNVIIVEDIIDTGLTLKYITAILKKRSPQSLKICCLLDKPSRRKSAIQPDYTGFVIEDLFVVGWGLDYAERYRNYPAIGVLNPAVYEK
ncbi:MAG: hypoxanthine phosphoribosyltransferase [Syntrophomonadaceae bacterium]|nr:hypoxanthine phosphoribosyltransferase [Syntrophomonadaceae bacterium]